MRMCVAQIALFINWPSQVIMQLFAIITHHALRIIGFIPLEWGVIISQYILLVDREPKCDIAVISLMRTYFSDVTFGPLVSSCTYYCADTRHFQGAAARCVVGIKVNHATHVRSSFFTLYKMDSLSFLMRNGRQYQAWQRILFVSCL